MNAVFFVVLAWCVPLLDLRTPAFVLDGLFDCHCPLTKQHRSINLGNAENQIRGCWLRCQNATFWDMLPPSGVFPMILISTLRLPSSISERLSWNFMASRFVFFFFPAANTHCRHIGAMNKVRRKKDQSPDNPPQRFMGMFDGSFRFVFIDFTLECCLEGAQSLGF